MKIMQLLIFILLSSGCGLLKKASKTQSTESQESEKHTQFNQFVLKSANKETQVFTYWNDSGFYQYQHIKERADQVTAGQLNVREAQLTKRKLVQKKSEPVNTWLYLGVLLIAIFVYGMYKRYRD